MAALPVLWRVRRALSCSCRSCSCAGAARRSKAGSGRGAGVSGVRRVGQKGTTARRPAAPPQRPPRSRWRATPGICASAAFSSRSQRLRPGCRRACRAGRSMPRLGSRRRRCQRRLADTGMSPRVWNAPRPRPADPSHPVLVRPGVAQVVAPSPPAPDRASARAFNSASSSACPPGSRDGRRLACCPGC